MGKKEDEEYSSMVNSNQMLLSFEGWIKYIEGFSRGLQTTKTVDAVTVFDCIGEIMEYMKSLKGQIITLLLHCEECLELEEQCDKRIGSFENQIKDLIESNKSLEEHNTELLEENEKLSIENEKLKQAIILLEEKKNG